MKYIQLEFANRKAKKANKSWTDAIQLLGGPSEASRLSGINQGAISQIIHGSMIKSKRFQRFPTIDQAIKISLLVDKKITAEDMLPEYDFSYLYRYFGDRDEEGRYS